jgi:uncharacterized UBP type Zn finger protein
MFKSLVGKGHAEFSTNHQQDAQEFLLYLLDMIDKIQVSLKLFEFVIVLLKSNIVFACFFPACKCQVRVSMVS